MKGLHAFARFRYVRFRGGPCDGELQRIQAPLPERLLIPISSGRERTWGRDETRVVGVARYALQMSGRRRYYALVETIEGKA